MSAPLAPPDCGVLERLYYLDDYTDEVMPCGPRLEEWAAWLAEGDVEWNTLPLTEERDFTGYAIDVLAVVRADWADDHWALAPAPPADADYFYVRWRETQGGWDVENSGDEPDIALCEIDHDTTVWLACTRKGPRFVATFHPGDPPHLTLKATGGDA